MKRHTHRHASPPPARTWSEHRLCFPEPGSTGRRTTPPSPERGRSSADLLQRLRSTEQQLAREIREYGGFVPQVPAIERFLKATVRSEPSFTADEPATVVHYLFKLRERLGQEAGPAEGGLPPLLLMPDHDGTSRPVDRIWGRDLLLRRWDGWIGGCTGLDAPRTAYLAQVRQRFADGIIHGQTILLDDWPMEDDLLLAALHSLIERVIEPSTGDMDAIDIAKEQVGLVISLPASLPAAGPVKRSTAGDQAQETPVAVVGEQVEQPVGAFPHIADAGVDVGQQPLLPDLTAVVEHQP